MRSLLAFAVLAAVMYVCGIGETKEPVTPASNTETSRSTPKPDRESLMREFLAFEKEFAKATFEGDISFLSNHLSDDFELTRIDGKVQNKNEALADVKKEKVVKSWSIDDPDLVSFTDDTAVMRYTFNLKLTSGGAGKARVTHTYVKKNGDWLVSSEQQTLIR
jgi:hypothetical protein